MLVVSDLRLLGWKQKNWKLCLELLWRGQMGILPLVIEEAIPLWKNETKCRFLYANLQIICLMQMMLFV